MSTIGHAFMFVDLVCGVDAIEVECDGANRAVGTVDPALLCLLRQHHVSLRS